MNRQRVLASVVIALALTLGMFVFAVGRHNPWSLVIHTKTLEKGMRYVVTEDKESNKLNRVDFEISSDEGDLCFYVIKLPRIRLKSVKILPLAQVGKFEIERITLANDTISYNWDQRMVCSQQLVQAQPIQQKRCDDGSPVIAMDKYSAIIISAIPDTGTVNPTRSRFLIALAAAGGFLLCALYLLRPTQEGRWQDKLQRYAARGAWLTLVLLYLYQLGMIWKFAIDIPYWEEWEFFEPQALQNGLSWQWLFCHFGTNKQIMVFTKLVAWLNFKLFSLDFVKLKVFNYIIFGCALVALGKFKLRVVGRKGFEFFPLFLIFMVSPIAYEVHIASFQSGEVFVLLFSLGMLNYAISLDKGLKSTLFFSLCAVLAMFSMHAGLVAALVVLLCRTLYLAAHLMQKGQDLRTGLRNILVSWGIVASGIVYWLHDFSKSAESQPWLLPTEGKFWDQFLNLLSFGFGFEIAQPIPGAVCLVLLLLPIVLLLQKKETRWQAATWQVMAAILAILAVLSLITLGRGNMIGSIKLSRYALYAFPLIPFASLAWWLVLKTRVRQCAGLALLWCFCAAAYWNDWGYGVYADLRQTELLNIECVARYLAGTGDGLCPGTHPLPIGNFFANAKKLDIHFTRQFVPAARGE
jgi:hypothetical protein